MTVTRIQQHGLRSLAVFLFVVAIAGASASAADSKRVLDEIEKRIGEIRLISSDRFVDESDLRKAREDLNLLWKKTSVVDAVVSNEKSADARNVQLQADLLTLMTTIDARLPAPPDTLQRGAESSRRAPFAVPHFGEGKLLSRLASELIEAQLLLREHLTKKPDDQQETKRLLKEVVLSEERLAWEAGWPFTPDEVRKYKAVNRMTDEVYLGRRNRGIQRINDQVQQVYELVGRTPPPPFTIHCPVDKADQKEIELELVEQRGVAEIWLKGTVPFDEAQRNALLGKE